MYYELYVDVLFLVNFMMDYLLLLIVRHMLKCTATHFRIALGAVLGAGLTCFIVILPIPYVIGKFAAFYLLVNTLMIIVGLKIREIRVFVKAMILLYIGAFLMGGLMGYVRQYMKMGSLFFAVAVLGYYVVLGIWNFLSYMQRFQQHICEVELYVSGKMAIVKGLVDTGNQLCDSISSKPVCIIGIGTVKENFGVEMPILRYIPYHTIGKAEGVMPIVKFDKMCIRGKKEMWLAEPLIAISEEEISRSKEYQMILNPNLF